MLDDLQYVTVQVQRPRGTFPGRIEEGYFAVDDDQVQLYDMHKVTMGPKYRQPIPKDWTPKQKAAMMLRGMATRRNADFGRPLHYPTLKY
jgi:hypothetical protein